MRVLVTTNAAIGHYLPMAATVAELVAAGHEVRVGCPASFAWFVRRTGFEPLGCAEVDVSVPVAPPAPTDRNDRLIWAITHSWPSDCRPWVDALLRHARQWRPDVVMVEPVEHAGRIVAAALGVPLVVHGWGFTLPAGIEERASAAVIDLYERESAAPPAPAAVADLGLAALQAADIGSVQRYRYQPFPVPGNPLPPPRSSKRRVLVTLGTYANPRAASSIRAAATGALENGAEVIAVLGSDDRGSPETFPPGATAIPWVDLPAAIADCDLVVHHGGAGTSWTTLSYGKPAVLFPQAGDQYRNAHLLADAGAVLVAQSDNDLAAVIERGLVGADLRQRAAQIARDNAAMPDVEHLAHQIATLNR